MDKQECSYCRKSFEIVNEKGHLQAHLNKAQQRCPGGDFPANWHSRELEFAEMYRKSRKP